MNLRTSIEPICHSKDTGQKPVVVSCDDFKDYLCKYPVASTSTRLMTEWVCAHAARCAGLNIPEFSLVTVAADHTPDRSAVSVLPNARFDVPLFGSQMVHEAKEVEQSVVLLFQSNTQKSKIRNKQTLLRIALFDIWMSNEDRNHNNYNLLMTMASGAYDWVVIDHGEAFNSNNAMQHGLTTLTYHDSILQSELYHLIFQKPHNFAAEIELILTQFDQWITKASHETVGWIDAAPDSWGANKDEWKTFLMDEWLSLSWSNDVKQAFREHCQSMIS